MLFALQNHLIGFFLLLQTVNHLQIVFLYFGKNAFEVLRIVKIELIGVVIVWD